MTLKTGQVPNMGKNTQNLGFPPPIPCVHDSVHGTKSWKRQDTNPYHSLRGITVLSSLKTFHQSVNTLANAVKSNRQASASGVGVRRTGKATVLI